MKTLYFAGYQPQARGFGWATCNSNLRTALGQLFRLVPNETEDGFPADAAFVPIVDHDLNPCEEIHPQWEKVIGYCFFEFPLGEKAAENAKRYDTVFCGSTWCLDRMIERGITNGKVLIQGVDHSVFKPGINTKSGAIRRSAFMDKPSEILRESTFRIFSGGKFEWRKGQDLVIRAFAEFAKTHPDAHLVCAWHNIWTGLIIDAVARAGMSFLHMRDFPAQEQLFEDLLIALGVSRSQFTILPQLSQDDLAREMQNTDVGLFPNRCEGGTNLVLMEYAACGGKVVANTKTGHLDVAAAIDVAIRAGEDEMHWADQKVSEIIESLEIAYSARDVPRVAYPDEQQWTWEAAAQTVADEIDRIAATK